MRPRRRDTLRRGVIEFKRTCTAPLCPRTVQERLAAASVLREERGSVVRDGREHSSSTSSHKHDGGDRGYRSCTRMCVSVRVCLIVLKLRELKEHMGF